MKRLVLAAALTIGLASPCLAESKPSIASGEAATREAALASALRHAVEQVVGMSINTGTYVTNLKSIQDNIYTGATGYIESYDVISEERTDGGYRLTVSAKVAKEKLASAMAPIVGSEVSFDGDVAIANANLSKANQKDTEAALKALIDELPKGAIKFAFKPRIEVGNDGDKYSILYLDDFSWRLDEGWYSKYRKLYDEIRTTPFAPSVMRHAASYVPRGNTFIVEFLNEANEVVGRASISEGSPVGYARCLYLSDSLLFKASELPVIPLEDAYEKAESTYQSPNCSVETRLLNHIKKLRVRSPQFGNWPTDSGS